MKNQLGEAFALFEESLHDNPVVSIRRNPKKSNTHIPDGEPIPWCAHGRYLPCRIPFTLDPVFHAGAYYVQEASSMFLEQLITHAVDIAQPLTILDLCAAPGGKSTHLLSLLPHTSFLVANESIRSRVDALVETLTKWGYPNHAITCADPQAFERLPGFFDVLVVDAPCSGEGLFRKDPDATREWSSGNVLHCAARQQRILTAAWPALKEDGVLIYSTCTLNRKENEENLQWMRDTFGVSFIDIHVDPSTGIEKISDGSIIGYRFFPHRVRGEGFFIAAMRKHESSGGPQRNTRFRLKPPTGALQKDLASWVATDVSPFFFEHPDGMIRLIPEQVRTDAERLVDTIGVVAVGTAVASVKQQKLIPEHALAMSVVNNHPFPVTDLTAEDALRYLRREPILTSPAHKGFGGVSFHGLPLGWVNVLQNRINNSYPSAWRIRMNG